MMSLTASLIILSLLLILSLLIILSLSGRNIHKDDKKIVDEIKAKTDSHSRNKTTFRSPSDNPLDIITKFPLCPVSFLKSDDVHDLTFTYRYPNLYFPNQSFTEENSYNCLFVNDYPGYTAPPLRCTMNYTCPIYPINIVTAMKKQRWVGSIKTFDKILSIEEESRIQNRHKGSDIRGSSSGNKPNKKPTVSTSSSSSAIAVMNVIVVGGSMTAGHDLLCGCICTHDLDPRCNSDLNDRCTGKPEPCTWEMHFSDWLKKQYPNINVKNFNFARGGVESSFHASFLSDRIHDNHIQLNEHDLFILDSSCNDAGLVSIIENKVGLEALIRRIQYIMAQALNQPFIRPTIIIIEQFPFPANIQGYYIFPNKELKHRDYANIYEDLASHYNLLLWSVRDVYWSYYDESIEASQRYPIAPIADDNDKSSNPMHRYVHIPWFGSLFMADLLAACFLQTLKDRNRATKLTSIESSSSIQLEAGSSTELNGTIDNTIINNENNNNNDYDAITDINISYPPQELYNHSSISKSYCNESKPFLIRNVSSTTFHPTNLNEYELTPQVGWREYIDYHDAPGYMINKFSDPQQRSLSFKFEFNVPEGIRSNRYKLYEWWRAKVLKIVFLRSYERMGAAKVFICGVEARKAYLDGLHSDYRHYKVSGPAFMFFTELHDFCPPPDNDNDMYYRGVEIRYEYPDYPSSDVRRNGKFKLMSIELCST
jgi:hypothetical protein